MKKIILLLSVAVLGFSCSDDDSDSGNDPALMGTWLYTSSTADDEVFELDECESMDTLVFTGDTATETYFEPDFSGDEVECIEGVDTYSYTANGGVISSDGESTDYLIDGDLLIFTDIDVYDSDGDGEDEETVYTTVYTKQ